MDVSPTKFSEVLLLTPRLFSDQRGYFFESYNTEKIAAIGISQNFVQDNQSRSYQGVLRGLHYQIQQAQGKLVSVLKGEIYDVVVDLRRFSPTFGKWEGYQLTSQEKTMIWVPAGFAHGFYTLSNLAEIQYKVTSYYAPQWERTLKWDDPDLAIEWPLIPSVDVRVSDKDQKGLLLKHSEVYNEENDLE